MVNKNNSANNRHTKRVHEELRRAVCLSPICRWRVELAFHSLATCEDSANEAEIAFNGRQVSLDTLSAVIGAMRTAKTSCGLLAATTARRSKTKTILLQRLTVTGVDVRSDATMRAAEIAFKQGFTQPLTTIRTNGS